MKVILKKTTKITNGSRITISGSKSETNRLLILQALFPEITILNASDSDDSLLLKKAISTASKQKKSKINIGHAGTAMRFLTAFFAAKEGVEVELSGSDRMHRRPIGILVDALRELGAEIIYLEKEGFPPLLIRGKAMEGIRVAINAGVSSQFITALLLIAPILPVGIEIELEDKLTSRSYLDMTLKILEKLQIDYFFEDGIIRVLPARKVYKKTITVESDWSSLSYYYSLLALLPAGSIHFNYFIENSFQGDAVLQDIYSNLGVKTVFDNNRQSLTLIRTEHDLPDGLYLDLNSTPDIAQTIAVTCFGLGIGCRLSGLHTLKIKETNRLEAIETELRKLGATVHVTDSSLHLEPSDKINPGITIQTYDDHRMAMAFAPLVSKTDLSIADAGVVSKSYPDFWQHLQEIGIQLEFSS